MNERFKRITGIITMSVFFAGALQSGRLLAYNQSAKDIDVRIFAESLYKSMIISGANKDTELAKRVSEGEAILYGCIFLADEGASVALVNLAKARIVNNEKRHFAYNAYLSILKETGFKRINVTKKECAKEADFWQNKNYSVY